MLEQTRRWFTRMGRTLNEQKTRVCDGRRERFVFLGYTFGPMRSREDGDRYVGAAPAPEAVRPVKGRIRQMLAPVNQAPWDQVVRAHNLVLQGWRQDSEVPEFTMPCAERVHVMRESGERPCGLRSRRSSPGPA